MTNEVIAAVILVILSRALLERADITRAAMNNANEASTFSLFPLSSAFSIDL